MNDSADYFESLELHAGEPDAPTTAPVNAENGDFIDTPRPAAENIQLAEGLEAMLHGDALEHVVAEMGAACVTRSDVATAVHTAVTDAVQAAVNGVVAVAVAAAVKANSSMNAEEVEKRFRQKYLGLGMPEVPGVDAPFLKAPRLQVEQDGSVALSPDAAMAVVELADDGTTLADQPFDASSLEEEEPAFVEPVIPEPVSPEPASLEPVVAEVAPEPISAVAVVEVAPELVELELVTPEPGEPVVAESAAEAVPELGVAEAVVEVMPEPVVPEPVIPEPVVEDSAALEAVAEAAPKPVVAESAAEVATEPVVPEPVIPEPVASAPADEAPVQELAAVPELRPSMPDLAREPESIERTLRNEKSIQFVGFLVGTQMYAVPSILIREVIRRQPLSRLPVQTRYAPGVINLRGQVIPVVSLRELLQADSPPEGSRNQFSIITGTENLRIALEVDKIRSMYVVQQEDIVWNVASVLGLDDDTVIGLFELEERLVPILSVERVAAILLEEGLDMEALTA